MLEAVHEFLNRHDSVDTGDVGTAEGEAAFEIAFHGVDERRCNAIGRFFLFAGADAVENALEGLSAAVAHGFDERIDKGATGHAYGTLDNGHKNQP